MSKTFRAWKIDEPLFLPATVGDFMAQDHLARFVLSLVRDDIDLAEVTGTYGSERGQPPYDPIMMTALLLYSYCCGIYSSRRIAKACRERVDFMSIVALDAPDFRTISDFRKRHLKALGKLFGQILRLCETAETRPETRCRNGSRTRIGVPKESAKPRPNWRRKRRRRPKPSSKERQRWRRSEKPRGAGKADAKPLRLLPSPMPRRRRTSPIPRAQAA